MKKLLPLIMIITLLVVANSTFALKEVNVSAVIEPADKIVTSQEVTT